MRNLNPPSIAGNWNFTETLVKDGQQTIYNPITITYNSVTIEQNGRFVSSKEDGSPTFLGVWKFNCKSGWDLYFIQNDNDNDTFIYTPVCIKNNIVYKIDGINFEAGTDPSNKDQVASVAYLTGIRVKDAKKNDLKK